MLGQKTKKCRKCNEPMKVKAAVHSTAAEEVIVVLQCDNCGAWTTDSDQGWCD